MINVLQIVMAKIGRIVASYKFNLVETETPYEYLITFPQSEYVEAGLLVTQLEFLGVNWSVLRPGVLWITLATANS